MSRLLRLLSLVVTAFALPGSASAATEISIDPSAGGRRFDGVGALSAGGSSRYLIDYPRPARDAILDYLFKPSYGATLQILKVEIGGDGNSTDGSEASVEHSRGAVDCRAGYEFWLMREAKRRNPAIKLYALAWGAPGWTGTFWSQNTIASILHWLACARRQGLTIDYLGGTQNESSYSKAWTVSLRRALDAAGFAGTRLVMAEAFDTAARWRVANDLASDPLFRRVTSVVGNHDVCGSPTNGKQCTTTTTAWNLGKPLWASELGAMDGNADAAAMARSIIRGYSQARLVGYVTWPLVSAIPPGLKHETFGLISTKQPWSGFYRVNAMTYAIAMMTWFTAPGWQYVNGANGPIGGAYANGSYATLKSPGGASWSTIAETTTATAAQTVSFAIRGALPRQTVRVWRTRPDSTSPADWMVRRPDVHPAGGRFSYRLLPGYLYAFTTLVRSGKGSAAAPAPRHFGTYVEDPNANLLDDSPLYLAPFDGAFRYQPCVTDPSSRCSQQMAPQPPVYWRSHPGFPHAVIGDESLDDYTVSCDVLFTRPGSSAGVIGRFSGRDRNISNLRNISNFRGYLLTLDDRGTWRLIKNSITARIDVLASGTLRAPAGVRTWHNLALAVDRSTLTAAIDGQRVGSVTDNDANYRSGLAGIEAGATMAGGAWTGTSWPIVQYRRLRVSRSLP
jgi:O-glycosyl hydrolase